MPPKGKKKRASLRLDTDSGQITESDTKKETEDTDTPPIRQVVEVVEDDAIADSIDTIKKDVEEIEDAVETVEEELEDLERLNEPSPPEEESPKDEGIMEPEDTKSSVESLFMKSTAPVTPDITVVGRKDRSLGVWIGAMLGIVLAIGVTLLFVVNGPPAFLSFGGAEPTPTPTEAPQPTPTPVSVLKREDIAISVLNGGGVPGAAGDMQDFLESKGYVVGSVGNADEYTYEETTILVKSGSDDVAELLREDLSQDYTIASETGTLDEDAEYEAQVIVGEE